MMSSPFRELWKIPAAITFALDAAERSGEPYDAVVALGCVVRGDTIHFEIVSMKSSRALMDLSVQRRVPLVMASSRSTPMRRRGRGRVLAN